MAEIIDLYKILKDLGVALNASGLNMTNPLCVTRVSWSMLTTIVFMVMVLITALPKLISSFRSGCTRSRTSDERDDEKSTSMQKARGEEEAAAAKTPRTPKRKSAAESDSGQASH